MYLAGYLNSTIESTFIYIVSFQATLIIQDELFQKKTLQNFYVFTLKLPNI